MSDTFHMQKTLCAERIVFIISAILLVSLHEGVKRNVGFVSYSLI
jgi:hypothetical protein